MALQGLLRPIFTDHLLHIGGRELAAFDASCTTPSTPRAFTSAPESTPYPQLPPSTWTAASSRCTQPPNSPTKSDTYAERAQRWN